MQPNILQNDELVRVMAQFREFLLNSWPALQPILQNHDWDEDAYFLEDWLDRNWDLLVGRQLLGRKANLQPLSAGFNNIKNGKYPICIRAEAPIRGTFVSMGTCEDGFSLAPPFDKVKILKDDGMVEILPLTAISFRLSI